MHEKQCPECGAGNPVSEEMCDHCGFSLDGVTAAAAPQRHPMGELCPDCGKQVSDAMRFCDGCGAALGFVVPDADGNLATPVAPPTPPAPPTQSALSPAPAPQLASDPTPVPPAAPVPAPVAAAPKVEPAPQVDVPAPAAAAAAPAQVAAPAPADPPLPSPAPPVAAVPTPVAPVAVPASAVDRTWKLTCVEGFHLGKEYLLYKEEMLLGRSDPESDIYPDLGLEDQDDGYVSRKHACLRIADGSITVEDLGGENGTQVDGRPLPAFKQTPLNEGQVVRVGKVGLMLKAHSAA